MVDKASFKSKKKGIKDANHATTAKKNPNNYVTERDWETE